MTASEDKSYITDALNELVELDEFKALVAKFKECNLNPFKFTTDGTPAGFSGLIEANELLRDIIHHGIVTVEKRCKELRLTLTSEDKLDAVAQFADDQIKLPMILEPFDKMIFKLLITQGVGWLNRLGTKNWIERLPNPDAIK